MAHESANNHLLLFPESTQNKSVEKPLWWNTNLSPSLGSCQTIPPILLAREV